MKRRSQKSSRRSGRTIVTVGIAAVAAIIVLTASFRVLRVIIMRGADNFYYPFLKTASGGAEKVSDKSLLLLSHAELAAKVESLSAGNRELVLQSKQAALLAEENRILRRMVSLDKRPEQSFVIAEIILRDPLRFRENFTIGKGANHGIVPGAAAVDISPDGRLLFIGIVTECGARTAKISTLADLSTHISGKVGANGAIGFTHTGTIPNSSHDRIKFGMLPIRDDYVAGGAVMTTGFEPGIPEGIKIGELYFRDSRMPGFGEPDLSCELKPAVRFEELRFVAVIIPAAGGVFKR